VGFVGGGLGQLPEAGLAQAAVASENAALLAEDRPSSDGRELIASIGFVKWPVRNAEPAESLQALVQLTFIGNAADDEMGMG
jgi:hypothetical protein